VERTESAFVRDNEERTKIHFSPLRSRKLARSAEPHCSHKALSLQLFNPQRREKKIRLLRWILFNSSTYRQY